MNHPASPLLLSHRDQNTLTNWAQTAIAPYRVVTRAKALLMAGDGAANSRIATALGVSRQTVLKWRARFLSDGLGSVGTVRTGRGRKPEITAHQVQAIVHSTLHETPPGATHWSCRSMAKAAGVSRSTVQRIWDAHGLQPHRVTTFKLSTDPAFVEKLTDVVGLYLNPPDKAVVLCVDEKSQIQALDRTQPGLPMKPGRHGTMTHDYKRHGTTTLFAALNVLTGTVIGVGYRRVGSRRKLRCDACPACGNEEPVVRVQVPVAHARNAVLSLVLLCAATTLEKSADPPQMPELPMRWHLPQPLDTRVLVGRIRLECTCRVVSEFTSRVHEEVPRRSFRGAGQHSSGCSTASSP